MIIIVKDSVRLNCAIDVETLCKVARPARWIVVKAIDVGLSTSVTIVLGPRSCPHVGVVGREWNINVPISGLLLQQLHVADSGSVGNLLVGVDPLLSILIFYLPKDDGTAVGNEMWAHIVGNLLGVSLPSLGVCGVVISKRAIFSGGEPARKAATVCLSVTIWARSINDVQAKFLGNFKGASKVMGPCFEIQGLVVGSMPAPMFIKANAIETSYL